MIDEANLKGYETLDGVPEAVVESAVFATDDKQLECLVNAHVGDRQGMKENLQAFPTTSQGESSRF